MSGPTLTMAPAVESTNTDVFHRAHSSPDLLLLRSLPKLPLPRSTQNFDHHRHTAGTTLPAKAPSVFTPPETVAAAAAGTAPLIASAPTPNASSSLSSFSTTSSFSPSTHKRLPSLPAFDVPSFDFDIDLDSELEFSVLRKQKKSKPPSEPPRRVWEEFIKTDNGDENSNTSESNSFASQFGQELESKFGAAPTGIGDNNPLRSLLDFAISSDSDFSTRDISAQQRPSTAVAPSTRQQAIDKEKATVDTEKLSRRKTLVEKPLSWIPSSRSVPDFHELLIKEREKEARRAKLAAAAAASAASSSSSETDKNERITNAIGTAAATSTEAPTVLLDSDRMVERQRTVSASFVDFARRSWISRSPSPSPQTPRKSPAKKDDKREGRLSRKRPVSTVLLISNSTASNEDKSGSEPEQLPEEGGLNTSGSTDASDGDGGKGPIGSAAKALGANGTTAAEATTTEAATTTVAASSSASTSRTFSRASTYLSRMKQRPQSMFVKITANTTNFSSPSDENSDDCEKPDGEDDEGNRRNPNRVSTASLPLSLELLSDKGAEAARAVGRKSPLPPGEEAGEPSGSRNSSSSSNSSSNSDDGSSDGSANGSTLLPASEAESLTTADTSNHASPMTNPASRDPLWVAFKDLETNFFKFLSKSTTAQRMIIVRATLIPFLRRYAVDGPNKNSSLLSPEDVERRASILNRWWTGLLEMLDGPSQWQGNSQGQGGGLFGGGTFFGTSTTANGNFQPVSGIDRPVVLESVSMIMSRPEWRLLTAVFRPLADRSPGERVRARPNTSDSRPLDDTSFLVEESAEHNVRTMFINNLLAQLILVVDKMAMRQAPLSIVNFSGKACAYAFFFVPGVADILIRLWGLDKSIELVRRVADAFGLPRRSRGESDDLIALFPPCVGPLGWTSVNAMQAKLRRPPRMSLLPPAYVAACSRVSWFAPCWLSRWRGADTDLLFIFCKYYHVLADEFMPASLQLPLVEKARAPGFVLLHAQLLQIFDNTIHRQAAVEAAMLMAGTAVGDDAPSLWMQQQMQQQQPYLMAGSEDGFVSSLMLQPNHNLFRDMDENRIIALLRDLLTSGESLAGARATFSESAMVLLKAATFRTSQYDHSACHILCDFLHEILQTLDSYYGYCSKDKNAGNTTSAAVDFIDWTFWLDICKLMLESNNTMSEIRVLSFIFATWDIVAADPGRKEELCVRWLLSEEVFNKFFNNWCPMVRAYYMRLLCWRMCRDSGSTNELDAKIFLLVSQRLKTVWSHYLWLKKKADNENSMQPSTVPSLPQPGKRFMIVRTEVNVPQLGLLANANGSGNASGNSRPPTTFDALASSVNGISNGGTNSYGSESSTSDSSLPPSVDEKKTEATSAKKKWSILGKVLNLTSKPPSEEDFEQMRRDTAVAMTASKPVGPAPPSKSARLRSTSSDSDSSTGSTPVFDASQFVFKFMLHNIPWQGFGGGQGEIVLPPAYRERVLTRPRLPAPAQARVSARIAASGKRSESPPPPAAGLPPITRRVSGFATGGLVNEARNANPAESVPVDDESSTSSRSASISSRPSLGYRRDSSPFASGGEWERGRSASPFAREGSPEDDFDRERERERIIVQPMEPKGHDALLRAKYAGRALAEWSLVVNECNSFIDRRRDEGIYGLKDVEVPTLGVEGMRRIG